MPFVATDEFLLMATGLVSHEISAYLSVFDPFFDLTREDNSAKLSCPDILGLCSNFVESESFLESNFPDIVAICETKFNGSIDSGNLSVRVIFL